MQQGFAEFNKISVEEIDALREENERLKRRLDAEVMIDKEKKKQIVDNAVLVQKTPFVIAIHENVDKIEYNPTPKTHHSLVMRGNRRQPFIVNITDTCLPK